jgi:hypothetical protein
MMRWNGDSFSSMHRIPLPCDPGAATLVDEVSAQNATDCDTTHAAARRTRESFHESLLLHPDVTAVFCGL